MINKSRTYNLCLAKHSLSQFNYNHFIWYEMVIPFNYNHFIWYDSENSAHRTEGPKDRRTEGPKDRRTEGPKDRRTEGPKDRRSAELLRSLPSPFGCGAAELRSCFAGWGVGRIHKIHIIYVIFMQLYIKRKF